MKFTLESSNINDYLKKTPIIDYDHIDIKKLAQKIDKQSGSRLDYIKNAYKYVGIRLLIPLIFQKSKSPAPQRYSKKNTVFVLQNHIYWLPCSAVRKSRQAFAIRD